MEVYVEKFTAKVNQEENHHEVILRGERSNSHLILTNVRGTKDIADGLVYELVIREPQAKAVQAKNEKILEEKNVGQNENSQKPAS